MKKLSFILVLSILFTSCGNWPQFQKDEPKNTCCDAVTDCEMYLEKCNDTINVLHFDLGKANVQIAELNETVLDEQYKYNDLKKTTDVERDAYKLWEKQYRQKLEDCEAFNADVLDANAELAVAVNELNESNDAYRASIDKWEESYQYLQDSTFIIELSWMEAELTELNRKIDISYDVLDNIKASEDPDWEEYDAVTFGLAKDIGKRDLLEDFIAFKKDDNED